MTRALLVDDEPYARKGVVALLERHPGIEIVGEAATGREAIRRIAELAPDLVFLDVQMPDLNGFEVLEGLPDEASPAIIFITAHDEYAVRAFDANAADYLLKPVDQDRFDQAVNRVLTLLADRGRVELDLVPLLEAYRSEVAAEKKEYLSRLTVPTRQGHKVLLVGEVDWIEAQDYYAKLHTGTEAYLARISMTRLASSLDPKTFVRVHRATIVNLDAVDVVEVSGSDRAWVLLKSGTRRRVSRSGLQALRGALAMLR